MFTVLHVYNDDLFVNEKVKEKGGENENNASLAFMYTSVNMVMKSIIESLFSVCYKSICS